MLGRLLIAPTVSEHRELRTDGAGGLDPRWGLTQQHKWFNLFFVFLPKITVGVLLFLTGVSFICLSSDDTELIIDTLAVTFILDIDAAVYKLCVSDWLKAAALRIPHLELMIRIDHVVTEASNKINSLADAAASKIRRGSDSRRRLGNPLKAAVSRWRLKRGSRAPGSPSRTRRAAPAKTRALRAFAHW